MSQITWTRTTDPVAMFVDNLLFLHDYRLPKTEGRALVCATPLKVRDLDQSLAFEVDWYGWFYVPPWRRPRVYPLTL